MVRYPKRELGFQLTDVWVAASEFGAFLNLINTEIDEARRQGCSANFSPLQHRI